MLEHELPQSVCHYPRSICDYNTSRIASREAATRIGALANVLASLRHRELINVLIVILDHVISILQHVPGQHRNDTFHSL